MSRKSDKQKRKRALKRKRARKKRQAAKARKGKQPAGKTYDVKLPLSALENAALPEDDGSLEELQQVMREGSMIYHQQLPVVVDYLAEKDEEDGFTDDLIPEGASDLDEELANALRVAAVVAGYLGESMRAEGVWVPVAPLDFNQTAMLEQLKDYGLEVLSWGPDQGTANEPWRAGMRSNIGEIEYWVDLNGKEKTQPEDGVSLAALVELPFSGCAAIDLYDLGKLDDEALEYLNTSVMKAMIAYVAMNPPTMNPEQDRDYVPEMRKSLAGTTLQLFANACFGRLESEVAGLDLDADMPANVLDKLKGLLD